MTKLRRSFTDEFKREDVALLEASGRPLEHVAGELGLQASVLRNWRRVAQGHPPRSRSGAAAVSGTAMPAKPDEQTAEIARLRRELERARQERDILKKGNQHLLGSTEMRFRFIEDHRDELPTRFMSSVLGVSASGYYAWRGRPESQRAATNRQLLAEVRRVHGRHHGRYGSPRVHAALRAEGVAASRGRVARLMRRHGIRGVAARRFRPVTTDSRHGLPVAPDLLGQAFQVAEPNRVWLADITYLSAAEGWLYLAAIPDLATRKIVRWAMRDHMRAELATSAWSWPSSAKGRRWASSSIPIAAVRADSSSRRNSLTQEVAMKKRKRGSDRSGRAALRSPGRLPSAQREDHRRFWAAIATGQSSEDAASLAGVSPAVGGRWFREAGGMPPAKFAPSAKLPSKRYLQFAEREEIAVRHA